MARSSTPPPSGAATSRPGCPVERDTIFRIASMTKPVTTVAALMLLDEGRFALDDPIAICAPELAHLRVLRDPEGPLDADRRGEATDHVPRSADASIGADVRRVSSWSDRSRVSPRHSAPQIDNPLTPDEWIARLATLPLIDQPGAGFHYSISTDLLGFLIARLDGASLGEVLATTSLRAARHARHRLRRATREARSPRRVVWLR